MRRRIFFRADAGPQTGYGHFVRSLALARMLAEDFDCRFFCHSPNEWQVQQAASACPLEAIPEGEEAFLEVLKGDEIVVLDGYGFDVAYQQQIRGKGCRLVCLDDLHDRHFVADLIVSPCLDDVALYDADACTRLALGPSYALLRSEFLRPAEDADRRGVMICFGGSDPHALSLRYARQIRSLMPQEPVYVVVGAGFSAIEELQAVEGIMIRRNLDASDMASLMRSCRFAVCSASGTCYEALACGCEVYAGHYVDNQRDFYALLCRRRLIHPLGNLLEDEPDFSTPAPDGELPVLDSAARYRKLFRALAMDIVPYQDMTEEQSRKVWECRNRPEIRGFMNNPEPFSLESHLRFVKGLETRSDCEYYAVFDGDDFLASYDFVDIRDGETADRGLFTAPEHQGEGIASALEALMECGIIRRGIHTLTANVLKRNEASFNYHLSQGYLVVDEDDKYYYLNKSL